MEGNSPDLGLHKELLNTTLRMQSVKEKNREIGLIKNTNFCCVKDIDQQVKKTFHRLGVNVCILYTVNKLYPEIIRNSQNSTIRKEENN